MKSEESKPNCQSCEERGRPGIPATRDVDGAPFCSWCFVGRDGPPRKAALPSAIKPKPRLRNEPARAAAIVADYEAGMRLDEIRGKHGCSSYAVLRLVRSARRTQRAEARGFGSAFGFVRDRQKLAT